MKDLFFFCIVSFSRWNLFILYTAILHTNMEMKRNCLFALPILFVLYLDCHQQRILFGFRRIPNFDIMSNGKKTEYFGKYSKVKILYHTKLSYLMLHDADKLSSYMYKYTSFSKLVIFCIYHTGVCIIRFYILNM